MNEIKDYIKSKRSSLSASSLTTYGSILKNLYKRVFQDTDYDLDKFDKHSKKVLEFLKDTPANNRKTILSALVVITDNNDFRSVMADDIKDYNENISKQEKTPAQQANWIETSEIRKVTNELKKTAELLMKKTALTAADLQQIQNYILLIVLGGSGLILPRRSKDYCDFKISAVNKDTDNYMDKNSFVFNSYKTAKTYGKQTIPIPVQLCNIIKKWIKINPTEYLLFDANNNKLSSVKLNQRLNKIFGGKISVNGLRHTYLTDTYAEHNKTEKKLENDMTAMGSSKNMASTYVKLD